MQITDKLIKPVTETTYLTAENVKRYRVILRFFYCGVCDLNYPKTQNAEIKAELLYKAGILKDDISSNVTCIGIRGYTETDELEKEIQEHTKTDNLQKEKHIETLKLHKGIQGFLEQGEMLHLNLHHLGKLKRVCAIGKKVYVVENPSIFQKLASETPGKATVICDNGQLRLAVLVLLDLLTESGCEIWYSGDFDPEGLCIVQKLKERYPNNLYLWHYEFEDYEQAKSKEPITNARLKQLDGLNDSILQNIAEWIKRDKVAGYQENIWERFKIEENN